MANKETNAAQGYTVGRESLSSSFRRFETDNNNVEVVQYSPKIMHAQKLLFASASRQLLAATCGTLALECSKPQELLWV